MRDFAPPASKGTTGAAAFVESLAWMYFACGALLHVAVLYLDSLLDSPTKRHFNRYHSSGYSSLFTALTLALCAARLLAALVLVTRSCRCRLFHGIISVPAVTAENTIANSSKHHHHRAKDTEAEDALAVKVSATCPMTSSSNRRPRIVPAVVLNVLAAGLFVYLFALSAFVVYAYGIDNLEELYRSDLLAGESAGGDQVLPTLMLCSLFLMCLCLMFLAYLKVRDAVEHALHHLESKIGED